MDFYIDIGGPKVMNGSILEERPPLKDDPWTWLRCCGADVSAPSESLAFYFGGLTASTQIPIVYGVSEGDPEQANVPTSDLIVCNTTILAQPVCGRSTPPGVPPRTESELIWVPYGIQGSLLSIGGTLIPSDLSVTGLNPIYVPSNSTNNYMTDVLIYDIDSGTWMSQQTDRTAPDTPGTLASFCSVMANSQDGKSHHIYIYGGYDGTYETFSSAYDTVWILSLPSFRWTMISDGTADHRRQNHKCVKTSPSQFFSIGGNLEFGQPLLTPYIDVFDMNKCVWNSSYDPTYWSEYVVPDVIQKNVPNMNTIPNNLDPQVAALLATPYTGPPIKDLERYAKPTLIGYAKRHGASWWLATVVVDLAYLSLASCALIIVVILRRRMAYRAAKIDMSDMSSKNQIVRWMHNAPTKTVESMEETKTLQSPKHYSDSLSESYVDEERIEYSAAPGQKKTSGTKVTTYERLNVDSVDDIELTSFTGSSHPRTL